MVILIYAQLNHSLFEAARLETGGIRRCWYIYVLHHMGWVSATERRYLASGHYSIYGSPLEGSRCRDVTPSQRGGGAGFPRSAFWFVVRNRKSAQEIIQSGARLIWISFALWVVTRNPVSLQKITQSRSRLIWFRGSFFSPSKHMLSQSWGRLLHVKS